MIHIDYSRLTLHKVNPGYYGDTTITRVREFKSASSIYLSGTPVACVTTDIKDHLIVFTTKEIAVYFADKNKENLLFSQIYCVGAKYFTNEVTYVLCQNLYETKLDGLRLLDIQSTIKRKEINLMLLKNIEFAISAHFEYSEDT